MKQTFLLLIFSAFATAFQLYQHKPLAQSIEEGKAIYQDFCVQCHLPNGQGVEGVYPPLAKADYLKNIEQSIKAIKYGLQGEIEVNGVRYNNRMAYQGLDDEEVADVLNYILREWGNQTTAIITTEQVAEIQN